MTPKFHPSDGLMLDFAAGRASVGTQLAIGVHLHACDRCQVLLTALEELGGLALEAIEPVPAGDVIPQDKLARASLGCQPQQPLADPLRLASARLRWAGLGVSLGQLPLTGSSEKAYLVRVRGGASVPEHTHTGRELVAVKSGGFSDGTRDFVAGDFIETQDGDEHHLVAHAGQTCVCVIVLQSKIRLKGTASWVQPFIGL